MYKKILTISEQKYYWLFLIVLCLCLEAGGLFYQYILEYLPCVLCIHVRIWVLGILLLSIIGLLFYKNKYALFILHILITLLLLGLFERSYQLLGTERGFIFGSCSMESGLPGWFALDEWMPVFFKVWEPCGYTPELLFGITMAEALIAISTSLLLVSIAFSIWILIFRIIKNTNTSTTA